MMCFDSTLRLHAAVMDNDESVRTVLSVSELCATLLRIDPDTLGDCQPQVELLHRVMQLAIRLWAAGAVVPQVMSMHHGKYAVRWLPAVLDEHVARWMEELEAVPLQEILRAKKYDQQRFEILKGLAILSDIEPRNTDKPANRIEDIHRAADILIPGATHIKTYDVPEYVDAAVGKLTEFSESGCEQ